MSSPLAQTIINGLTAIDQADRDRLLVMLTYFDRSSLWVNKVEGGDTTNPTFRLANEAEAFVLNLDELRRLHDDMKKGIPVPWDTLPRHR